jgi:hypothetical protein
MIISALLIQVVFSGKRGWWPFLPLRHRAHLRLRAMQNFTRRELLKHCCRNLSCGHIHDQFVRGGGQRPSSFPRYGFVLPTLKRKFVPLVEDIGRTVGAHALNTFRRRLRLCRDIVVGQRVANRGEGEKMSAVLTGDSPACHKPISRHLDRVWLKALAAGIPSMMYKSDVSS